MDSNLWWLPTLNNYCSTFWVDLAPFSRARADQTIISRLWNFGKSPFQAWNMVICKWLIKICENWLMGTLFEQLPQVQISWKFKNICRAWSVYSGFWNVWKVSFLAWVLDDTILVTICGTSWQIFPKLRIFSGFHCFHFHYELVLAVSFIIESGSKICLPRLLTLTSSKINNKMHLSQAARKGNFSIFQPAVSPAWCINLQNWIKE